MKILMSCRGKIDAEFCSSSCCVCGDVNHLVPPRGSTTQEDENTKTNCRRTNAREGRVERPCGRLEQCALETWCCCLLCAEAVPSNTHTTSGRIPSGANILGRTSREGGISAPSPTSVHKLSLIPCTMQMGRGSGGGQRHDHHTINRQIH